MIESVSGHQEPPTLRLPTDLAPIFAGWQMFGLPSTVYGGLSVAVVDESGRLYAPRGAWLDEQGIHGAERELYRACWAAMDREHNTHQRERLEAAGKVKDN